MRLSFVRSVWAASSQPVVIDCGKPRRASVCTALPAWRAARSGNPEKRSGTRNNTKVEETPHGGRDALIPIVLSTSNAPESRSRRTRGRFFVHPVSYPLSNRGQIASERYLGAIPNAT